MVFNDRVFCASDAHWLGGELVLRQPIYSLHRGHFQRRDERHELLVFG